MAEVNLSSFSLWFTSSIYNEDVCPNPPSSTNFSAFLTAASKSLALYIASTGESFSWAKASSISTDSTSPIKTLVSTGTSKPASFAIVQAVCPTILEFNPPFTKIIFLIFSVSSLSNK